MTGWSMPRMFTHARILLTAYQATASANEPIADAVKTGQPTVSRVRKQCVQEVSRSARRDAFRELPTL